MWSKPFKPPLLKKPAKPIDSDDEERIIDLTDSSRPHKKRRLIHVIEESPTKPSQAPPRIIVAPRKPFLPLINPGVAGNATTKSIEGPEGYYLVLWLVFLQFQRGGGCNG